jgi:uncharacterized protein YukE
LFNYDQPEVQTARQNVQTQLARSRENTATLMNAVKIVQDGAWIGQGATAFLADAAHLKSEIEAMHEALSAYLGALGQASSTADGAIATLQQLIGALP